MYIKTITLFSAQQVCFDIVTFGVKMNGLNTDFDGSGVAVNQ